MEQQGDADVLKRELEERENAIQVLITNIFSTEFDMDWQYFVQMKVKLVQDSREIEDNIKLGQEQIDALRKSSNVK